MDSSVDSFPTPIQHNHTHTDAFKHWFGGVHFQFPHYKHDHPPVINVNEVADEKLTMGQKVADKVAEVMGSWNFIITQALIMV